MSSVEMRKIEYITQEGEKVYAVLCYNCKGMSNTYVAKSITSKQVDETLEETILRRLPKSTSDIDK